MRDCPGEAVLRLLVDGELDEPDLSDVAGHLDGCPACQRLLDAEDALDPVVRLATASTWVAGEASPTVCEPAMPAVAGYEILEELGRGAMGVVYKARQVKADRVVALKVIHASGLAREAAVARFRTEAEAAARLQDAGVVQIFDVGDSDGVPYLTLEYCPGGTLAQRLAGNPVAPAEAAALAEQLARAVAAAHAKGIVHRDLKPANVLVAEDGRLKVGDFGLAKKLDAVAGQTRLGIVMGTASYMAPEQARGDGPGVGPPADVWALGAVLYEMLTGRPPFLGATDLETLDQVRDQEPVPVRRLQPRCPADLETICLTCLTKVPARRYASAAALAEDLKRFQAGEPVAARPAGAGERLIKWARRRPTAAALVGVSALAALAFVAVSAFFLDRLAYERNQALTAKQEAEARNYAGELQLAQAAWKDHRFREAITHLDKAPAAYRGWEYRHLRFLYTRYRQRTIDGHEGPVRGVDYSPDGGRVVTAGDGRTVRVWDARTGRALWKGEGHSAPVYSVSFSPDGSRVASGSQDGAVRMWNAEDGTLDFEVKDPAGPVTQVAFSPDGLRLAVAHGDYLASGNPGAVRIIDARTGGAAEVAPPCGRSGGVWGVGFSPDGRRLVTAESDGARLWDARTGREVRVFDDHDMPLRCVGISPDNKVLVTGSDDDTVKIWDLATGEVLWTCHGHAGDIWGVDFCPDQPRVATVASDGTAKVWDLKTGRECFTLRGHSRCVFGVAFSPDGRSLATASEDGTCKVWEAVTGQEPLTFRGHADQVRGVDFSPDGRTVATGSNDGTVKLWDAETGDLRQELLGHELAVISLAFHPRGGRLATAGEDHVVRLWDVASGRMATEFRGHAGVVFCLAFSTDGRNLASAGEDGHVIVWPAAGGPAVRTFEAERGAIFGVTFSPDGRRIAVGCDDGSTIIWDVAGGQVVRTLKGHSGRVWSVAWHGPLARIATGGMDGVVRIWDAGSGALLHTLEGHADEVFGVHFSPDGRRLASGGADGYLKLWCPLTGHEVFTFQGHTRTVTCVRFSPDGRRLASASHDTTARVLEAPRAAGGRPGGP